jgi:hypothetical protein
MTTRPAPAPGFRIERCGLLYVYTPVKPKAAS